MNEQPRLTVSEKFFYSLAFNSASRVFTLPLPRSTVLLSKFFVERSKPFERRSGGPTLLTQSVPPNSPNEWSKDSEVVHVLMRGSRVTLCVL